LAISSRFIAKTWKRFCKYWSLELHDGWGLSGMLTEFLRPAELTPKRITETTFVIEKKVTEKAALFVE
jgi:hypothetical protein